MLPIEIIRRAELPSNVPSNLDYYSSHNMILQAKKAQQRPFFNVFPYVVFILLCKHNFSACVAVSLARLGLTVTRYTPLNINTTASTFTTLNRSIPQQTATMLATRGCI